MESDCPRLTVGDPHPLAKDAVVFGVEAHRDLERAVGVDEDDVGCGAHDADVLHQSLAHADDDLVVDQMIEPVVMGREGLLRAGTVMLRKAEK